MDNSFKSKIRSLKVSLINGDINTGIKEKRVREIKKELDILNSKFDDYILTGSTVLFLMGWLDRKPNDYDVILPSEEVNKHEKDIDKVGNMYTGHDELSERRVGVMIVPMGGLSDNKTPKISNRFGIVGNFLGGVVDMFSHEENPSDNLTIDIFVNDESSYDSVLINGREIKIDSPINILNIKNELNTLKSENDIYNIFNKFYRK